MNFRLCIAALLLAASVTPALAQETPTVKDLHREAAQRYFENLRKGVKLSGSVTENGSPGTFEAYFHGDGWLVRQRFGDLEAMSYDGPEGSWSKSNYTLSYQLEAEDNPASATLTLLTDGEYLNEPYWDAFVYVDDVAGGYNFSFEPAGMPPAEVVLYSDRADPHYLQIMSVEIRLSPLDDDSHTYRSFYYYDVDEAGNVYTARETGREIDSAGEEASFSEYIVEDVSPIDALPEVYQEIVAREPVGDRGSVLSAPLEIETDNGSGYFILPVTFEGSDKTWRFIFDTGASASLFTPEAAEAAGLVPSISVPAHGHGSRVDFEMGLVTTASIGRADADPSERAPLAGFPAARLSEDNGDVLAAFKQYDAAGIIGVSLLHQYIASFDQLGGKITLYAPDQFGGKDSVPTPNVEIWLDVEDLIYLPGYISDDAQKIKGELVLDTGLQQQLAVLRETVDFHQLNLPTVDSRSATVLGGVREFDHVTVPMLEIAVMNWPNVEASVTDDDKGTLSARKVLGFLGVPFFFGTTITLDLPGQRMYIQPPSEEEMKAMVEQMQQLEQQERDAQESEDDDEADS